jgi:Ca2+:H+ antiporter
MNSREQVFNITVTSTMSSLMTIAAASLVLPATFSASVGHSKNVERSVLVLSRGTAIVLLLLYASYLFFKLWTHGHLLAAEQAEQAEESEEGERVLRPFTAFLVICIFSTMVVFCSFYLIDSILSIVEAGKMSQSFFGILLIPVMGNAVEHLNTGAAAWRDEMEMVIGLAIGNSMQIALFTTPFLVMLGWIIGQPMSLNFSNFEAIMSFVSVFLVSLIVLDGKSNYLEGIMCVGM